MRTWSTLPSVDSRRTPRLKISHVSRRNSLHLQPGFTQWVAKFQIAMWSKHNFTMHMEKEGRHSWTWNRSSLSVFRCGSMNKLDIHSNHPFLRPKGRSMLTAYEKTRPRPIHRYLRIHQSLSILDSDVDVPLDTDRLSRYLDANVIWGYGPILIFFARLLINILLVSSVFLSLKCEKMVIKFKARSAWQPQPPTQNQILQRFSVCLAPWLSCCTKCPRFSVHGWFPNCLFLPLKFHLGAHVNTMG